MANWLVLYVGVVASSLIVSHCAIVSVNAQYDYGGNSGYYDNGAADEERPKVHLGIRLRIPAIKFELPRFSLPKITVSAKIRQPDRPRTITLPEINLDTSSKVAPPGNEPPPQQDHDQHHGYQQSAASQTNSHPQSYDAGNYQHKTLMAGSSYGSNSQDTTLSFSTEDQQQPQQQQQQQQYQQQQHPISGYGQRANYGSYLISGGGGGKRNQYSLRGTHGYRQQQQQQMLSSSRGPAYGATNVQPTYIMTSDTVNGNSKWPGIDRQQQASVQTDDENNAAKFNGNNSEPNSSNGINTEDNANNNNNNNNNDEPTVTIDNDHLRRRQVARQRENYFVTPFNQQINNVQRFG